MVCIQRLHLQWPSTEWETVRCKNPGKMGKKMENGPWPGNGRKWPPKWKNGPKNGILAIFSLFFPFWWPFFGHFRLGAFSIVFPIFPGFLRRTGFPFCRWPPQTQYTDKNDLEINHLFVEDADTAVLLQLGGGRTADQNK